MPKLSICLIAHNEEKNLRRTLSSVSWADEIIYVDCESTDSSKEIAREYTDKVYQRINHSNLNVNKNYSFDQATGDWILCLDADEVIPTELRSEIRTILSREDIPEGYYIKRKNYYFGTWLRYGGQFPDLQLRLFRRGKGRFPEGHVHERMKIEGPTAVLQVPFKHYPYETISQYLRKLDFYTEFEAKKFVSRGISPSFGTSLYYLFIRPGKRFISRYFVKRGFLDGVPGFLGCFFDAMAQIIAYGKFFVETQTHE